ncbi:hypothetical protein SAMN04487850_0080 [Prevotella aff. ruminicola Tc2-24]|jgi:hypothetical protein|uniref:Uncharacterized protein n=1 Tax=Prevotella aff. ruminicola Tc2-24 TaxID=81582 RepID=A0A1I0LY33_9BACT|nr:hypothetical protein [Prevotella aff. ruminicola Tc2-24]SEV80616.1 hypothetical protein SAMN04487850_0080 [Prevotella aff. ruminicola Tc2-24]
MRFFKHITLAVALLTASTLPLSAKSTQASKAYMFGFSASFNDSIVYFTDIQEVDSVWTNGKGRFLAGRNQYSYQLREYFTTKLGMARRTCVVVSSLKRKDVEKKYAKMKKQYIEKKAGKFDVRFLSAEDFRFVAVDMSDSEQVSQQSVKAKKQKEKKAKDKKSKAKATPDKKK